ncbi:Putative non-specific lipid-transfer protein 14 [Morus notabilis]|uniref:Putative non-specific lipid-transfer protein 14 n=2 Tax=Morus notabilis TaxID=981085 RepID=W9S7F4_9ROSA|nr:Putative non-specific lipid-transfer protein 14 [Morus notabilis]
MSIIIGVLLYFSLWASLVSCSPECSTVTELFSACSTFITYGSPDPFPGSPCCHAMNSLNFDVIADSIEQRRFVCHCLMDLIMAYNSNASTIAALPGFCGISLGFTIDPNTDCNL